MANWRSRVKVMGVVTPSPVGVAMRVAEIAGAVLPSARSQAAL